MAHRDRLVAKEGELGKGIFGLDRKTEESVCTGLFRTKPQTFFLYYYFYNC